MERVSASDDLVDLLITDRLAEDEKSPKQLGASTQPIRNRPRPAMYS